MGYWKSEAICLRVLDYGETSHIVTLFTKARGRVSAIAKGARRRGSAFFGDLEPLRRFEVVLADRKRSDLHTLTETSVEDTYRGARRSLDRLHAALYVVELVREVTVENEPQHELFDLTRRALERIARNQSYSPLTVIIFELLALEALGFGLCLDRCASSGQEIPDSGPLWFGPIEGGVILPEHARADRDRRPMTREALVAAKLLATSPERVRELQITPHLVAELRGHLDAFVAARLERSLRLARYLR